MVMINNVDHVLALVRGQLERMSRDKRVGAGKKAQRNDGARATEKSRLQVISNLSEISDEEFQRLLVGALLSREFGEETAQDPRFQSVIDRTWNILRADEGLRALMQDVRSSLKKNGPGQAAT